jgi:hypothetical protein
VRVRSFLAAGMLAVGLASLGAAALAGSAGANSGGDGSFHTATISGHDCNSTQWQFVITQIDGTAPGSITVSWSNGTSSVVGLSSTSGSVAHYRTTQHLTDGVTVVGASVELPEGTTVGNFNLSDGPCGSTTTTHPPSSSSSVPPSSSSTTTEPPTTTTEPPTTTTTTAPATNTEGLTSAASDTGPLTATPGQAVTVFGHGFAPGGSLAVSFFSSPVHLGSTVADASGAYRVTVTIPSDATPGDHQIVVTGPAAVGGTLASVTPVKVVVAATVAGTIAVAPAAPPVAEVAFTGADLVRLLAFALGLFGFGFGLVRAGRKSNRVRRWPWS